MNYGPVIKRITKPNIYRLDRIDNYDYGDYYSCVVTAESKEEARKLADEKLSSYCHITNSQKTHWLKYKTSTCELIGVAARNRKKGVECSANEGDM